MTENKQKNKGGRPPQHGGFSFLVKGDPISLPRKRRYIRPYLANARAGWIRDIGPTEADLTTSQRVLIDRAVTFLGAIRLVEEHLKERGLFENPGGFLNAHLTQHYLAWNRALVECLRLLGIDKKQAANAIPTIAEIIAEADVEDAQAQAAPTSKPGAARRGDLRTTRARAWEQAREKQDDGRAEGTHRRDQEEQPRDGEGPDQRI